MTFRTDLGFRRMGLFAVACQSLIGRLYAGKAESPHVLGSGQSDPLPRPGVYALLAGFDRH